jgi:acetyl-CoA synthetase
MRDKPFWKWDIPTDFNIGDACTQKGLSEKKTEIAICIDHTQLGLQSLTYDALYKLTEQFANALYAAGIRAGDRILIRLANRIEYPICFFGVLKLGAIAVPSSVQLTAEELAFLIEDAGAKMLITETESWPRLQAALLNANQKESGHLSQVILVGDDEAITPSLPYVQSQHFNQLMAKHYPPRPNIQTKADDPAYLVYTSGTTGFPKGVLHAHRALLGRTPASQHWFQFTDQQERILHTGKLNWTYVLGTGLMDPLFHGHSVFLYEGENKASTWMDLIARHQCTIFVAVPTIYRQIIQKTDLSNNDVPTLHHCMCAGEHLSSEMQTAWTARFGCPIYEALGMSECSYYLSHYPGIKIKPGAAGRPQPGHHIALLDEAGRPVPNNQEGMIAIPLNDPGLFLEYWHRPEETNQSRAGGYFLTGDYASRDDEGYIWFLGRHDDIINSFGYRISPHEIERVLKDHENIVDAVAIGEKLEKDKQIVTACVILKPNKVLLESDVITYCHTRLATYKVPKKVKFMSHFPRTRNGKIIRKALINP